MNKKIWICDNGHTLNVKRYSYVELAENGKPVCGVAMDDTDCGYDMELVNKKDIINDNA